MKLHGNKVYLSKGISEAGYHNLFRWFLDVEVMKNIGFAKRSLGFKNIAETKSFVSELEDGIFFEIYCDGNMIGYTSLSDFKEDSCEFGIIIGEKHYWSRGIGKEATLLTTNYAFEELGVKRVILSVCKLHGLAIRVYESCGFRVYDIRKNAREVFCNGDWVFADTVKMEVLKNNFTLG